MLLAGLPKEMNTNHSNIHLLTTSNRVNALDLIKPIVHELKQLEYGVFIWIFLSLLLYLLSYVIILEHLSFVVI